MVRSLRTQPVLKPLSFPGLRSRLYEHKRDISQENISNTNPAKLSPGERLFFSFKIKRPAIWYPGSNFYSGIFHIVNSPIFEGMKFSRRHLFKILLALGLVLLVVDITGIILPNIVRTFASQHKKGVPGYDHALLAKKDLLKLLQQKADTSKASFIADVTQTAHLAMFHTEDRRISFFENWILWLAGRFYPPFRRTQDVRLLVEGRAGNCSERTQVLLAIYRLNGLDVQALLLNGHVVLRVFFNGRWIISDPDFGLTAEGDIGYMRSAEGLAYADSLLTSKGFSFYLRDRYLYFWRVSADDKILPLNRPVSYRLYHIERITRWLKWFIPLFLLIAGLIALRHKRTIPVNLMG